MELLRLLTPFDYTLMLLLAVIFVFSLMEGGHKKHWAHAIKAARFAPRQAHPGDRVRYDRMMKFIEWKNSSSAVKFGCCPTPVSC